ncbi:carbohydrate sulfotransferase 5-like [Ambystoma mexicanum]|uniref:carbohydrate sulfotransferase 5-like n=1 Tax=Ambystoma mexicanum TaxID=8296 RepID=UPI0037E8D1F5
MVGRCFVCKLYLLVLAIVVLSSLYSSWQLQKLPPAFLNKPLTPKAKTHLLIISTWRSGSSFLGQLFNHSPDVFYLLEPTRAVWFSMAEKSPYFLHTPVRELVRSIFRCDMQAFLPYMPKGKFISELFGWHESRALCSPKTCSSMPPSDIIDRPECNRTCRQVPFEKMEEACKAHSHVVVKEVRFLDLEALYPLLRDPHLNLKIIHLVRDPRAIVSSRESFLELEVDDAIISNAQKATPNISVVMQEICGAQQRMYQTALRDPPPLLKDRYIMVRYEDLVKDPLGHLRTWYKYIGLSMPSKLQSWIYNITHGSGPKDKGFMPFTGDSLKIAQHWRDRLEFKKVQRLQDVCKQEMAMFGYRLVENEAEQKDMSLGLVLPMKPKSRL